ncbi:hypothetical protein HDU76_011319, partial [Blyttiomyces sp. JEL0837]
MESEINERAILEQDLRDENEHMNIFRNITHLIRQSLDRTIILETAARESCCRFKARRCLIYLPVSSNPENNQLQCVAEFIRPNNPSSESSSQSSSGNHSRDGDEITETTSLLQHQSNTESYIHSRLTMESNGKNRNPMPDPLDPERSLSGVMLDRDIPCI